MSANWWDSAPLAKQDQGADNWWQDAPIAKPASIDRTWGEAIKDVGASFGAGSGGLLELGGTLFGLASGDMDNWARRQGERTREFYQDKKSTGLLARERIRDDIISQGDGELEQLWLMLRETATDPALLSTFMAEQVPNLVTSGVGGRLVGAGAKALGAGAKVTGTAAVGGAIGTGAAMQGGDAGGDAYDRLQGLQGRPEQSLDADDMWAANQAYDRLVAEGTPPEEARHQVALELSRWAFIKSAAVSGVVNSVVPGARAIERGMVGKLAREGSGGLMGAAKGATKGGLGETFAEGADEGFGRYAANVAVGEVDPLQSSTEGVGRATAEGMLFGPFGAVAGGVEGYQGRQAVPGAPAGPPAGRVEPTIGPQDDVQQVTAAEVETFAADRLRALDEKAEGTQATEAVTPDGQRVTVPGQQSGFLTDAERAERDFLRQNSSNPEAIAAAYGAQLRPEGEVERAQRETPPLTPEDQASPLPNDLIQAGRETLAGAEGTVRANQILEAAGFPPIGSRIGVVGRDGAHVFGNIVDAFDNGAQIRFDDGRVVSETFEALRGRTTAQEVQTDEMQEGQERQGRREEAVAPGARQTPDGYDIPAEFSALFSQSGQRRLPAAPEVQAFREQHGLGNDGVAAIVGAIRRGESISIEQAREIDRQRKAERQANLEREQSEEGRAESARRETEKADREQAERDRVIAEAGEIAPGIYVDTDTGQRFEVLSTGMVLIENPDGDMVPYGTIKKGASDQNGVAFSTFVQRGMVSRDAAQQRAERPEAPGEITTPLPEASAPAALRGESIDGEWARFSETSGSLNVPRDSMPQIKAEHRGALANFLKARGIDGAEAEVPAASLKPTQAEFSEKKVKKAREFEGGDRAILVSSDGHILDGHHQWLAKVDAGESLRVIRLDAPIARLLEVVPEFPSAEGGAPTPAAPEPAPEGVKWHKKVELYKDPRWQDEGTRQAVYGLVSNLVPGGGSTLVLGGWRMGRTGKGGEWVDTFRTPSENPPYIQRLREAYNYPIAKMPEIVKKAMEGKLLGKSQQNFIRDLLDELDAQQRASLPAEPLFTDESYTESLDDPASWADADAATDRGLADIARELEEAGFRDQVDEIIERAAIAGWSDEHTIRMLQELRRGQDDTRPSEPDQAPTESVEAEATRAAPAGDLFGQDTSQEQAIANAKRAVDERLSPDRDVPADQGAGPQLFGQSSRQVDITDIAGRPDAAAPAVDFAAMPRKQFKATFQGEVYDRQGAWLGNLHIVDGQRYVVPIRESKVLGQTAVAAVDLARRGAAQVSAARSVQQFEYRGKATITPVADIEMAAPAATDTLVDVHGEQRGKWEFEGYEERVIKHRDEGPLGQDIIRKEVDWSRAETSAGSGQQIGYIWWLKNKDTGEVRPFGRDTAYLAMGGTEKAAQQRADEFLAQQQRATTEAGEARKSAETFARDTLEGANKAFRDRNQGGDLQRALARSVLLRRGTEFFRTARSGAEALQPLFDDGWRIQHTGIGVKLPNEIRAKYMAETEPKPTGAGAVATREQNARDSFVEAVTEQFGLTVDQARAALNKLLAEKAVTLDRIGGQFNLKDGRLWDADVMRRAAGIDAAAPEAADAFRLYADRIRSGMTAAELGALYREAGVRTADAFTDLPITDQAAAYQRYVEAGGRAIEVPADYNATVRLAEQEADLRRREHNDEIGTTDGGPFKSQAAAQRALNELPDAGDFARNLFGLYRKGGGFVLRRWSREAGAGAMDANWVDQAAAERTRKENRAAMMRERGLTEDEFGNLVPAGQPTEAPSTGATETAPKSARGKFIQDVMREFGLTKPQAEIAYRSMKDRLEVILIDGGEYSVLRPESWNKTMMLRAAGDQAAWGDTEMPSWLQAEVAKDAPANAVMPPPAPGAPIGDFGEVLQGARKMTWQDYSDRLKEAGELDVAAEPLSKSWPEPDYQKMLDEGGDPWTVAFIHAARDEVPTKPQKGWKVKQWAEQVTQLRKFANELMDGTVTTDRLKSEIAKPKYSRVFRSMMDRVELYQLVGHAKSLKGVRISMGTYGVYKGETFSEPKVIWTVERKAKATAFSNWPTTLAEGATRAEAIETFRKNIDNIETQPRTSKQVKFSIYSKRGEDGYWIGKKVGRDYADLKRFDTVKEARTYLAENRAELEKMLAKWKEIPAHRKADNAPRMGGDHRADLPTSRLVHAVVERANADAKKIRDALIGQARGAKGASAVNVPSPFGPGNWSGFSDDVNTALRERPSYMTVVSANLLGDLAKADAIEVELFGKRNVPIVTAVQEAMLVLGKDDKVLRAVVERIPVDVMDFLAGKQITPESLFRDKSVLESLFTSQSGVPVRPGGGNPVVALMRAVAGDRAVVVTANDPARIALEGDAALMAGEVNSGIEQPSLSHDVTPDDFQRAFSFKGVQFGNYVEGPRRQADLNRAYDALMDMAGILGVPSKALSLNGELGLAFGARGTGGKNAAAAHYEPGTVVINLTKREGAGSLAHEWWHALDNYFSRMRGKKGEYLTEAERDAARERLAQRAVRRQEGEPAPDPFEGVRPEMVEAFRNLVATINQTSLKERSKTLDKRRGKDYWTTGREMSARSFESYIISKLHDEGAANDYLANIIDDKTWEAAQAMGLEDAGYPYILTDELPAIRAAFDHLFQTIEAVPQEDGRVLLREESGLYSGYDGDTRAVQDQRRAGSTDPAQAAFNFDRPADVQTAEQQYADNFAIHFRRIPVRTFKVGVERVTTLEEAGHVLAPLRKEAQEVFYTMVLDGDRRILDIQSHTRGDRAGAMVPLEVVIPAILGTKGARYVVFAHNHPSGATNASQADEVIANRMHEALRNTGVETMGHVILTRGGKVTTFHPTIPNEAVETIKPRLRKRTAEVTETRLRKVPRERLEKVQTPDEGRRALAKINAPDALVLLDNRHHIIGSLALTPAEMERLRGGDNIQRIHKAIDSTNASAAIVKITGTGDMPATKRAAQNIVKFINATTGRNIRVLDVFYSRTGGQALVSDGETGELGALNMGSTEWFSLARGNPQTETAEFKRWFGKSKVVDEAGKPLVVYHGTDVDFTAFDVNKIKSRFPFSIGYHFTTRPSEADVYASDGLGENRKMREGGNVMPAYVRLENPLIVDTKYPSASMEADLNKGPIIDKLAAARRAGKPHDGIIIRRTRGDEWDSWNVIAFRPEQIKSAVGNTGAFDPSNPDIRYSIPGQPWYFSALSSAADGLDGKAVTTQEAIQGLVAALEAASSRGQRAAALEVIDNILQLDGVPLAGEGAANLVQGEPTAREGHNEGVLRDAEAMRNIIGTDAFLEQGFSGLDIESQRLMQAHMLRSIGNEQIAERIIQLIPVDVVNDLIGKQVTTESGADNATMLQGPVSEDLRLDVPVHINVPDALVIALTHSTAEEAAGLAGPDLGAGALDGRAASGAVDGSHVGDDTRYELTEKARAEFGSVIADLENRLKEIGVSGSVTLKLRQAIRQSDGRFVAGARGRYFARTIEVVVDHEGDAPWTLDHETIHLLRDLGLFRAPEWRALTRAAEGDAGRMDEIRERYKARRLADDALQEEGIADFYADWRAGRRQAKGFLRTALEKIRNFIEALGNALRGNGFQSAADIFERIDRGEVGRRSGRPDQARGSDGRFALRAGDFNPAAAGAPPPPTTTPSGPPAPFPNGFADVNESLVDLVRQKLQDKFIDLKRVQESTGRVPDEMDAYLQEEVYHGKAEQAIEEARETAMRPLLDAIREAGLTVDQAGEYLYARHAAERNARIAEINPVFADGGGSGMTDAEAATVLAQYRSPAMDRIAAMVDAITARHRNLLVASGLEKAETVAAWEAMYENYVPLKGREGDADGRISPSRGRGFDVRGRTKAATGRRSRAQNIVANMLAQYETDIIRSQKAEVGRALMRFIEAHPDPALWEIDRVEYAGKINPTTGLVEYRPDSRYKLADNVLVVKVDGVDHHITFHGERGKRIAGAMKNLGAANAGQYVRAFAALNRVLSAVNTSLNPEFVISNLARDLQTAGINLAGTEADAVKMRIIKDVGRAWRGIRRSQKGKDGEWAAHWEEFRAAGGKTGWIDAHNDVNRLHSKLQKEIEAYHQKPGDPRRVIRAIGKFVEAENVAVENAVRLSSFVHGRRLGMSPARAASMAKNLTVNFNRKGEYGVLMNSLYLFYNASIQGSVRMFQALRSPKVRKIAGSIVVFAAMVDILNRVLGGDDEDDEPLYDKIPPFIKERNLIIMAPMAEDGYFKIPLPWGYNVFHVIGQQIGEGASAAMGLKSEYKPLDSATTVLAAIAGSFNPLGSDASIGQFISPTFSDPIVSLEGNRDWAGRPIRPGENPFEKAPTPDSQKYWQSTGEVPRWIAAKLNALTGGSEVRPGAADVSPTTLEYLYEFATGGAGRFVSNTVDAPLKKLVEGEIDTYRIPFVRKVYGEVGSRMTQDRFYENIEQVYYADAELKAARENGDRDAEYRVREKRAAYLAARLRAKAVEKRLRAMREQRNSLRAQDMPERERRERVREVEERMEREMLEFNRYIKERGR